MEWIIRLPILIIFFIAIIIGIIDFLGLIKFRIKNKDNFCDMMDCAEKYFKYFYFGRFLWMTAVVGFGTIFLVVYAITGFK